MLCEFDLSESDQKQSFKNDVFRFWKMSDHYRSFGAEADFGETPFRSRFSEVLNGCQDVFDLACGSGDNLPFMPGGISYTGMDCSEVGLQKLEERSDHALLTKSTICGDVESIPLPDESQDAVISTYSFEHFLDVPKILAECSRVIRPEGKLVIVGPDFQYLNSFGPPQNHGLHQNRKGLASYAWQRLGRRILFGTGANRVVFEYVEPLQLTDDSYKQDHDMTYLTDHAMIAKYLKPFGFRTLEYHHSAPKTKNPVRRLLSLLGLWGSVSDVMIVLQKTQSSSGKDGGGETTERLVWKQPAMSSTTATAL